MLQKKVNSILAKINFFIYENVYYLKVLLWMSLGIYTKMMVQLNMVIK
jgi:hypothetical protein